MLLIYIIFRYIPLEVKLFAKLRILKLTLVTKKFQQISDHQNNNQYEIKIAFTNLKLIIFLRFGSKKISLANQINVYKVTTRKMAKFHVVLVFHRTRSLLSKHFSRCSAGIFSPSTQKKQNDRVNMLVAFVFKSYHVQKLPIKKRP